jgi:predicted Zn finger-like uncharacterized protein
MKIVCDACQAKYSISDDKVQGKVFKIRCKKCSNIIVVRGGAGAAEPAPAPQQEKDTRVYDYGYEGGDRAPAGDEAVWHVVINQDQVGPMTAVEVRQRFSSGEIDAETYVWREGFADWMPLAQVDTFAALAASPAPASSARGGGAEAVASMFGGGEDAGTARSDPGDLFAAASASARADDDGGDLFGSKPAAQPSAGTAKMRGERNENSVLFSLNNLAQLASDKPIAAAPHTPSVTPSATPGSSGGEGSGLIDIRSMASAYLGGGSAGAAKPASAGIGSIDDLPVFGGGGFSEPAVIVPIAARANNNKLMYALIGSVALLAVAAVVVVIVMLRGGDKPATNAVAVQDKAESPRPGEPPSSTASAGAPPSGTGDKAADPATPSAPDPGTAGTPGTAAKPPEGSAPTGTTPSGDKPTRVAVVDPPADPKRTTTPTRPTTPAAPPRTRPAVVDKTPAAPPPPKEPPKDTSKDAGKDSGCDEVSCVLNNYEGACCAKLKGRGGSKPSGGAAPSGSKGDVPDGLDKAMISDGLSKVKAKASSCSEKSAAKGQVKISVKVGPDGHVTSVTVKNTPDAALGACVQSVMQKATFGKTQTGGSFAYAYTF